MASSSNQVFFCPENLHNSCNRYSDLQVDFTANNNDSLLSVLVMMRLRILLKVDENKVEPYSGQIFRDIETCFKFYAEYGRQGGFDIRKSSQKVRDGIVVYKYFVCSKGGHNHPLVSTSGKQFLRINRTISSLQRRFILDAAKSNIGAHRAHSLYKSIAGSYTDVGATATYFQKWVRDIKLYIGKHDADMLLKKFQNKRETSDAGFAYEYQTYLDGHLTRLFWADITGRQSYEVFGDVVSFDATYRTNNVTFASALLNHEDSTNFTWVCEMFFKVFQQTPKCIITDQCPAMKVAINKIFLNSIHRYCMWHIMQKFTAKVGPVFCADSVFMEKLNKFVWSSHLTKSEFEEGWNSVLNEFGLSEHRGDTLSEFYICYESAIEIEKEAAQLYTRTMFYKVQKQIKASCFHISLVGQPIVVDGVSKYIFLFDVMNSLKIRVEEKFESSRATKEDMLEECFGVRPSTITTVHPPL
nr:PREDICTED: protein FAR1-RELATED SEQUENCE 5-like [Daucus carota subsp. sativus]